MYFFLIPCRVNCSCSWRQTSRFLAASISPDVSWSRRCTSRISGLISVRWACSDTSPWLRLGTDSRPEGGIFDVAALVDSAVGTQQRCADLEAGVGGIGAGHGFFGQFNQLFRCHYRISFAKLWPGVVYSTPSSSVTVAAISAKLSRVPRSPVLIPLPRISRGTYSRVWSVVAV